MQIVARGEFHPSARSIALQSTSTSPRSNAASVSANSRFGVSPETGRASMPACCIASATWCAWRTPAV
jgi:hypothetical protein